MHGLVDNDGNLQARANYNWVPQQIPAPVQEDEDGVNVPQEPQPVETPAKGATIASTSKFQAQLSTQASQSMVQLEHDHQGPDYAINVKAINMNPVDRPPSYDLKKTTSTTGIFSISYLQSISKHITCGLELQLQKLSPDTEETSVNYCVRYAPTPVELPLPPSFPADLPVPFLHVNPKDPTSVLTATFTPSSGIIQSTFWRRINPRLELATELQMLATPTTQRGGPGRRGGLASVGFKLETIYANIRGMFDTHGRVSAIVEEKIAPGLSFSICAEMDYGAVKGGQGKIGFGFTLEQ